MVDTMQYGVKKLCSSFLYWDGEVCVVIDVGTSDNVQNLLSTIRKLEIPYTAVQGVIVSHYHFDHGGGALKLWRRMQKKNPNFKLYVPQLTHDKLQNAEEHLRGARTTFGDFVGTMKPIPEEAFVIVEMDKPIPIKLGKENQIFLLHTPGHSPDHCSPIVRSNGQVEFIYGAEGSGSLFQWEELKSLPSSMPPNFSYNLYMASLEKIIKQDPPALGVCHFGAIKGKEDVREFLQNDKETVTNFRKAIIDAFNENPSTRHVIESTRLLWKDRFDSSMENGNLNKAFLENLLLALTYGQMIDLGYRKSKYETRIV